MVEAAKT